MFELNNNEFLMLSDYLKKNYGINLTNKKTFIESRLYNHIINQGYDNYGAYISHVFSDPSGQELSVLLEKLTTNHTYFMREPEHFEYLYQTVLPEITNTLKDYDLRVWSAGCSSGEEPYTLAMLFDRYFKRLPIITQEYWDKKILATDISRKVLSMAVKAEYPASALDFLPSDWKQDYFIPLNEASYKLKEPLRKEVIFKVYNLLDPDIPFRKKLHIIFCRNVMIYFDQKTKDHLIDRFYDMTEPGGYLFIGHSETIDKNSSPYKYIMPSVYRKEL